MKSLVIIRQCMAELRYTAYKFLRSQLIPEWKKSIDDLGHFGSVVLSRLVKIQGFSLLYSGDIFTESQISQANGSLCRILIKFVCTNDDEHCNVESSLLILFIIRNLVFVQFLLQVAHL